MMSKKYVINASGYRFNGCKLNKKSLTAAIRHYGFIECQDILSFLNYVCGIYPDRCSLIWLKEKTSECLDKHDDGSEYFTMLRTLVNEFEYALSIKKTI